MPNSAGPLQVSVAVILKSGKCLITERARSAHLGGLWEFPGGKRESGESAYEALVRELKEEVGIQITAATPLFRIEHEYSDRELVLEIFSVENFAGHAYSREGQALKWVPVEKLPDYEFPAANQPIINYLLSDTGE